ncbi:MAG: hypothetical protein AB8G96_03365 [Phycisphaerales bacterium]
MFKAHRQERGVPPAARATGPRSAPLVCVMAMVFSVLPTTMAAASGAAAGLGRTASDSASTSASNPPPIDDRQVAAAVDALCAELLRRAHPEHGWDPPRWSAADGSIYQTGGYSALVALALVRAGTPLQTPALRAVVEQLERMPMRGTYAIATRASLWAELPPRYHDRLVADVDALHRAFDVARRGWNYAIDAPGGRRDHSLRQFAALALWDAAARGVPTPPRLWAEVEAAFVSSQDAEGGWNYTENAAPARGSMTAAAIATLIMAEDHVPPSTNGRRSRRASADDERRRARRDAIRRGLDWLDGSFDPSRNPGTGRWFSYYAYAVERVGLATGRTHFGREAWFPALAATTIQRTCRTDEDGTLVGRRDRRTVDLAFGLLLLSRGRVPLVAGKLVVPGNPAGNTPRDVGALARAADRALEADHGWIEVPADRSVDAWLRAPLLVSSGREALQFAGDAEAQDDDGPHAVDNRAMSVESFQRRLRAFIDRGGVLLVVDRGSGRHRRSLLQQLMATHPHLQVERASAEHPVHRFHRRPRRRVPVDFVHDGARTVAILVSGDGWLADPPAAASPTSRSARGRSPATPPSAPKPTPQETVLMNCLLALVDDVPLRPRLAPVAWPDAAAFDLAAAGSLTTSRTRPDPATNASPVTCLNHPRAWPGDAAAEQALLHRLASDGPAPASDSASARVSAAPGLLIVSGTKWNLGADRDAKASTGDAADVDALIDSAIDAAAGRTILFTTAGGHGDFSRVVEALVRRKSGAEPRRGGMMTWLRGPLPQSAGDSDSHADADADAENVDNAGTTKSRTADGKAPASERFADDTNKAAIHDAFGDLRRVRFSAAARVETGPRPAAPRLTRIDVPSAVDGEPPVRIVFSHDDLLVAQLGRGQLGRRGPVPDDAARLLSALVRRPLPDE